ncbi:dynamin family protein [Microbacterium sp. W1N]|uniref:dynamin family protein n=1 Tax=Microbacterium festucae TaxID=2977531 RepID=UPI0021C05538|nr:dynamin family protein [Microbacterium festucae]MCT9818968.1 dynamin family protein [Microbacterium festucae]
MSDPTGDAAPSANELVRAADQLMQLCRLADRDDLAEHLVHTRARLVDPYVRVLVVGEYKQGKSKLINALVGAPVCPVDDDVATRVATVVGYGQTPEAALIVREKPDAEPHRRGIPIDDVAGVVTSARPRHEGAEVLGAEVLLPREILKGGLRLVDSPGVGDVESFRELSTLSALAGAHAMLLVSDASQEYTAPELRLITQALRISTNVAAVVSKTDVYPEWRRIEQIDRRHLADVGDVPVFAVSSDLRLTAAAERDRELNDESGFPALVSHLRTQVVGRTEALQRRAAAADLASVADQLLIAVQSELHALEHPEQTPELIAKLEIAKGRADEFRSRSSRWQTTLTDGIGDLIADTEHDLRDRLRRVQRQAEEAIDEGDPGPIWDEFAAWLDERVGEAVSDTFVWTNERQQWLAREVADQFLEGEDDIPDIDVSDITGVLDPVDEIAGMDAASLSAAEKIYIGVRGSYGGVLMVGLATSVLGLSVLNPLSLLAGVFVGRRAYREDKQARLSRRQSEAKALVRRYIDEVAFQVGKQLRDRLRAVQRATRDHFGSRADEIHRSLTAAADAARLAAGSFAKDREGRIEHLRARTQQLTGMRRALPAPAPRAALPATPPPRPPLPQTPAATAAAAPSFTGRA